MTAAERAKLKFRFSYGVLGRGEPVEGVDAGKVRTATFAEVRSRERMTCTECGRPIAAKVKHYRSTDGHAFRLHLGCGDPVE